MDMIVTTAGRQALVNAQQTGTASVVINKIGVGTGKYTATDSQTALVSETKRLPIVEGGSAGDNAIHVAYQDAGSDAYAVHEIGLFLEDGTLFAVTSQTTAILQKTATSTALIVLDIVFADVNVSSITFGDVTFSNPAASASNAGVVVLATDDEVAAGTNTQKVVTPAALLKRTATASRIGLVELATDDEAKAGTDASRAVTPAAAKAAIDARAATSADTISGTKTSAFVTPAGLKSLTSTTARSGLIELATEAEATAGTDTARAVTPATAKAAVDSRIASSTDTIAGTSADTLVTPAGVKAAIDARAATSAETIAGTLATRFVTPAGLKTLTATASRAGLVELATNAETTAGTDSVRAVTPAGLKAMFRTVEITDNSNIVNTEGNGNLSFYPSGTSSLTQARAGTSQLAVARFSDGESGPSMVFYKSRGSSIKSSKSVLPGDNVGMITFLADNGNIDYTGSSIGARVAFIYADVFENSTVTASGTKNLGIRGALRFYVCSDSADRTGTGVELIDNSFRPTSDSVMQLGTAGRRFTNIYATNGTINTSDEREKTDIKPIDNTVLDAWSRVNFCEYRLKTGDRVHIGVIAQRVAEAFHAEGLDAHDYGLFCEDTDEDGVVRFGIRYTEALALECALQRRETERLKERLNALEKGAD